MLHINCACFYNEDNDRKWLPFASVRVIKATPVQPADTFVLPVGDIVVVTPPLPSPLHFSD